MRYINKTLLPDEKIIFRTKKHLIVFYIPALWAIMIIAFLLTPNPLVNKIVFVPIFGAVVTGINQWLDYITADFAVTNKRIILREGFFFRHMNEVQLSKIANIATNQSLLGQLLGYGTVIINPFGGNSDIFSAIDNPLEFQKAAQLQLDNIKS